MHGFCKRSSDLGLIATGCMRKKIFKKSLSQDAVWGHELGIGGMGDFPGARIFRSLCSPAGVCRLHLCNTSAFLRLLGKLAGIKSRGAAPGFVGSFLSDQGMGTKRDVCRFFFLRSTCANVRANWGKCNKQRSDVCGNRKGCAALLCN